MQFVTTCFDVMNILFAHKLRKQENIFFWIGSS